jgi:hypothetical protein
VSLALLLLLQVLLLLLLDFLGAAFGVYSSLAPGFFSPSSAPVMNVVGSAARRTQCRLLARGARSRLVERGALGEDERGAAGREGADGGHVDDDEVGV